ncbi:MAG: N-acetylglucosamine-6-phosphate deacetylase [Alphaproteobacteria bacterium]|nr:N-acetylglucosamine-6-phosphate deacetylase [Alphaproteobacteria bacterium]
MAALAATRVFTGTDLLENATVFIEGGRITEVRPGLSSGADAHDGLLAPGFIDVQVNGGGGAQFNDNPAVETLRTITDAHIQFGVTGIMATLISDQRGKVAAAIDAVDEGIREGLPGLLGLHLEGPWLSAPRRGVHPQEFLRTMDAGDLDLLAKERDFPVLVTLAPEQASPDDVKRLTGAGIQVSIGHTAAPAEILEPLLDAGATGFTHLFNAMPPLEGRNPGPIGVALAHSETWAGIILDGIHVHPISARAAFAAKSARKLMLVSDAMATVGATDPTMRLFGERVTVSNGALRTSTGTLAGAHLELSTAACNATTLIQASQEQALRMASLTPAEFLNIDHERGRIAAGGRADMVLLGPDLDVRGVWSAGNRIR